MVWQVHLDKVKPRSFYGESCFPRKLISLRAAARGTGSDKKPWDWRYNQCSDQRVNTRFRGNNRGYKRLCLLAGNGNAVITNHITKWYLCCLTIHHFERLWVESNSFSGTLGMRMLLKSKDWVPPMLRACRPQPAGMTAFICSLKSEFRKANPLKLEKLWTELRWEHA